MRDGDKDDREYELSTCEGKTRFDSARLAKSVAKRRARSGRKGEAYACPFCRYWHIGLRHRFRKPPKDTSRAKSKRQHDY